MVGGTGGSLIDVYYNSTDHCIHNFWAPLTNPDRDPVKTFGFVKYSINFVRSNQPQAILQP